MNRIFTSLAVFVVCFGCLGQSLQHPNVSLINNMPVNSIAHFNPGGLGKTGACGIDTLNYTFNKTTAFQAITLNATSSGSIFAQWYPAPQSVTVYGFDFYGWQSAGTNAVVSLTCRMYAAATDSTPTGSPLASVTFNIDSTFGGGLLSVLRKHVVFTTPVTTSAAYVLTVETSSSVNVGIVANSWSSSPPNGRMEWLSSVKIGTNMRRSYNVLIGTTIFDADFIFQPYVSYSLTANFVPSTFCNHAGDSIYFTNTSSPVIFNRFYNLWAFYSVPQYNFLWDYGDTTPQYNTVNGAKVYNYNLAYSVKLRDTMYGWYTGCADSRTITLGVSPPSTNASNNGPLCIGATLRLHADSVPGVSYYWTGPNGFTSTQQNPVITNAGISMIGNYSVRTVSGICSSAVAVTYVNVVSSITATSNGPLCVGQTLNLGATAISGATYSWTGPNSFSSSLQNPSKPGVTSADSGLYQVTVALAGCGTMGPFSVSAAVNPIPTTPSVSNNGPLCVGDNLNLTASSYPGGSYSWIGPNNYSSTQQNPTRSSVLNTYAGSYSVTVSKAGCTSQQATTTVTINNVPPAPTAGNNGPLCSGQTLSLTATTVFGATYSWSGPDTFSSTQQNPSRLSITVADAGIYSVVAIVGGCASTAATTSVAITTNTPTPTAGSNSPLCPGQNLQLTASNITGASYQWTGPDSFTSTQQNPIVNSVTLAKAGIYSVTATTSSCGTSSAGTVNVLINTLPAAPSVGNNGPLCEGTTLNLTASGVTGASYTWNGPGGFTSTQQNPSVANITNAKSGYYKVFVTVANCGVSPSDSTLVTTHHVPGVPTATGSSPACTGDTLRLSAAASGVGPNVSYAWTGPNNFNSGLRNPFIAGVASLNAGTYSLTVTDSGCTSPTATTAVVVKSVPSAPTPGSNSPLCSGGNLFLTASSITDATYHWTGPSGFTSDVQNPFITNAATGNSGSYSVKSTLGGCTSLPASVNVVINPLPATPIVSNNGPKCVGDNVSLSASLITGATYSWTGPNNFSSTLQNPVLNSVTTGMSGTYSVIAISSTCSSVPGTTDVVVNNYPTAPSLSSNPSGAVCAGDSLQLFAGFVNGAAYEWTGPAGFGSSLQNPVLHNVTNANGGTYSATITKGGCTSQSSSMPIVVNPLPATSAITGPATAKRTEIKTYSVNNTIGSVYAWTITKGSLQSGASSNSITVQWDSTGVGTVSVRETNSNGCTGAVQQISVAVGNASGIDPSFFEINRIVVFPNPATDALRASFELVQAADVRFRFIDVTGRICLDKTVSAPLGSSEIAFDISGLRTGIYFVNMTVNGETRVLKLVAGQ
jgi:hypothetical protein